MTLQQRLQADRMQIDPILMAWFDLWRSHAYISYTVSKELISDLYDVKNPRVLQDILLNAWFDQLYNSTNFSNDLWNWSAQALRRHGIMPIGVLEEEAYGVLV